MLDMWFMAAAVQDNNMYWISELGGFFTRMNLDTYQAEYIPIPGVEAKNSSVIYAACGKIYAILNGGQGILIYDIDKKTYTVIPLNMQEYMLNMYSSVKRYKDELIIVPAFSERIIRLDIISEKIHIDDTLEDSDSGEIKRYHTLTDYCEDNAIWIYLSTKDRLVKYNLDTGKCDEYILPYSVGNIVHVICREDKAYLLTMDGRLYEWNISSGELKNLLEIKDKDISLGRMNYINDKIWLFPHKSDDIYVYDRKEEKLLRYKDYPEDFSYTAPEEMGRYSYSTEDDRYIYMAVHSANYMLAINKENGAGKWIGVNVPSEAQTIDFLMQNKTTFFSEDMVSLETYLDYIMSR